jgi:hypothetical protein
MKFGRLKKGSVINMVIKFVAKVGELKYNTSMGRSLTVIIPREQRDAEGIQLGDWVKVIMKRETFEDIIPEAMKSE